MKTMKQTGKKVLSVFLAVLMVMTAWVFVAPTEAEAALPDTSSLDAAIAAYESKMDGTIYKNMQQAYYDYITALEVRDAYKYGADTAPTVTLAQAEANLEASTANMTVWSLASGYTKVAPSFDTTQNGSVTSGTHYDNIVYTEQMRSADKYQARTDTNCAVWMFNAPTVLVVDGITDPRMPVIFSARRYNSKTRYVYGVYPTNSSSSTDDNTYMRLIDYWHGSNGTNLDFAWHMTQGSTPGYNQATGMDGNQSTDHRSNSLGNSEYYYANVLKYVSGSLGTNPYINLDSPKNESGTGTDLHYYVGSGDSANSDVMWAVAPRGISIINYALLKTKIEEYAKTLLQNVENYTLESVDYWTLLGAIDNATNWSIKYSTSGKTSAGGIGDAAGLTSGYNYGYASSQTSGDHTGDTGMANVVAAVATDMQTLYNNVNTLKANISGTDTAEYANLRSEITTSEAIYIADHSQYTDASWSTFATAYTNAQAFMAATEGKYYAEASTAQTRYTALKNAREGLTLKTFNVTFDNLFDFKNFAISTGSLTIDERTDTGFTITSTSGTDANTGFSAAIPVTPGKTYILSADAEFVQTSGGYDVYVHTLDANQAGETTATPDTTNGAHREGNVYISLTGQTTNKKPYIKFTAGSNTAYIKIRFDANAVGNKLTVNNIRVNEYGKVADGVSYVNSIEYTYGDALGTLPTPTRTGYTFGGWVDADGNAVSSSAKVDATETFYSTWTANPYTITFVNEDGTVLQSSDVAYDSTPSYTGETPTKAPDATYHYTFKEWSPAVTSVTGAATYTAQFTGTEHTYNNNTPSYYDAEYHKIKCDNCDYEKSVAHSLEKQTTSTKAATCIEDGYTDYGKYCPDCNSTYGSGRDTIPATGHKFGDIVTATDSGCETAGNEAYKQCETCKLYFAADAAANSTDGKNSADDFAKATLGHTEVTDAAVAATCTTTGLTEGKHCSECNKVLVAQTVVDALGHTFGTTVEAKAATCLADGNTAYKQCETCTLYFASVADENSTDGKNDNSSFILKQRDHSYTGEIKNDKDNDVNGTHSFKCVNGCNGYGNAVKHTWDDGVVTKAVTCTEDGTTKHTCTVEGCGATYNETIPATGHTAAEAVKEKVVAATCLLGGSYDSVVYCATCGTELSRETITVNALGHTAGADATCTTAQTCTVCQAVITAALGHEDANGDNACDRCGTTMCDHTSYGTETINEKAATCTTPGYTGDVICSNCKAPVTPGTVINALGHTPGAAATCTTDQVCTGCGDTLAYAFGHTAAEAVKEKVVAATCTTGGSYDSVVYCATCKTELSRTPVTVAPLGHKEAAAVKEKEVAETCLTDGSYDLVVYCSVCGGELSRETITVDALGHTFGATVEANAATCLADGNEAYKYCGTCKKYFAADADTDSADGKDDNSSFILTKLEHSYTGEILNDGNTKDSTHSFKCVNGCGEYGGAVNHTWNDGDVIIQVTCTTDGEVKYTCTAENCGATYSETVLATNHKNNVHTPASTSSNACAGISNDEYWTCRDCGKVFSAYDEENDVFSGEVTDLTDSNNNGILDHFETVGNGHTFGNDYVQISGGVTGKHCVVCSRCGAYGTEEAHDYVETVTDSTCSVAGSIVNACSKCDAKYTETIAKKAHTLKAVEAVAPDCQNSGNNAYYQCEACSQCFKDAAGTQATTADAEFLPVTDHKSSGHHDYDTLVSEATCQSPAIYNDHCDYCKGKLLATGGLTHTYGDPDTTNGHKFDGDLQPNNDGTHSKKCTVENCTAVGEATACTYTVTEEVASTCKTYGYTVETCDCGHEKRTDKTTLNYDNHVNTYIIASQEPTCNTLGSTGIEKCSECNAKISTKINDIPVDLSKHEAMTEYDAKEATCQEEGYEAYRYCAACGTYEIEKVTIAKKAHTFTTYTSNNDGTHTATCDTCAEGTEKATDTKDCSGGTANCIDEAICSTCNTAYGDVDSSNHKSAVKVDKVDSTCQTEGYEAYRRCTACNTDLETKTTIAKKLHTYSDWSKVDGEDKHTRSCTTCVDTDVLDIDTQTENCSGGVANCVEKAKCDTCKAEYGELGTAHKSESWHYDEATVKAATCQAEGYTGDKLYDCCNAKKEAGEAIDKLGHSYTVEVEGSRVDATCKEAGEVTYKCSTCVESEGVTAATKKETLAIDKNNHASTEVEFKNKKDVTCTTDGYTGDKYYKCCNALKEKGSVVKANGQHTYTTPVAEYLVNVVETKDADGNVTKVELVAKTTEITYDDMVAARHTADDKWYHVQVCTVCYDLKYSACYTYNHTSNCVEYSACEICSGLCSLKDPTTHKSALTYVEKVAPTCGATGTKAYYECEDCGKKFYDEAGQKLVEKDADLTLPKTSDDHIVDETTVKNNGDGTHSFGCEVEGCTGVNNEKCSGGKATCKDKAICDICGVAYGELDPTNHAGEDEVVIGAFDETCSEDGYTGDRYYACCYKEDGTEEENKNALIAKGEAIPADASAHVEVLTNVGDNHTVTCSACGNTLRTEAHSWAAGEKPDSVSCTEGYDITYTCACTATKTENVPAKGHDYKSSTVTTPATCTAAGSKVTTKTCSACGDTTVDTTTIAALGHDIVKNGGYGATCSKPGKTDKEYCKVCGTVISESVDIPSTGCIDANEDGYCDFCKEYLRTNADNTNCGCICHKQNVLMKFLYKILRFFWKLFKINPTCCSAGVHY